jgi:uncharacterized membrane protein YedE/YeeE
MNWIWKQITAESWNPYVAGALFGVVVALAPVLTGNLMGSSGSFLNIAGLIEQTIAPKLADNMFFKYIWKLGINWQLVLLVGVFVGAMASSMFSRTFKFSHSTSQWKTIFGPEAWKRWVLAFLAGIIVQYGASLAGGCTSGLAISGTMLLAPAGLIFTAGLFGTGIITTLVLYGRRY